MRFRLPILMILALTAMWLLLTSSFTVGQILLGLGVSLLMVYGYRAVRPVLPRLHRPQKALVLLWRVFVDIVRSNLAVARIVLGLKRKSAIRSGFLEVPLDMRDPYALAVLATIVTSTPGTIWAGLSQDSATLTLHVLDLRDERAMIDTIKQRYERLLMEIFE
jgi:multicomponent K+:H+ antiporter subunit E